MVSVECGCVWQMWNISKVTPNKGKKNIPLCLGACNARSTDQHYLSVAELSCKLDEHKTIKANSKHIMHIRTSYTHTQLANNSIDESRFDFAKRRFVSPFCLPPSVLLRSQAATPFKYPLAFNRLITHLIASWIPLNLVTICAPFVFTIWTSVLRCGNISWSVVINYIRSFIVKMGKHSVTFDPIRRM